MPPRMGRGSLVVGHERRGLAPNQPQAGPADGNSTSLLVQVGTTTLAPGDHHRASVSRLHLPQSPFREKSDRSVLGDGERRRVAHAHPGPPAAFQKSYSEEQRLEIVKFVLQDHNYGAPPPASPSTSVSHHKSAINGGNSSVLPQASYGPPSSTKTYNYGLKVATDDDDANSIISSSGDREVEPEGEETETAPEGDDEDSVTRCICDFEHDDGYMICCDKCLVWQHVDCMGIDRSNIPDEYQCERCQPRRVDRQRARTVQLRKRDELIDSAGASSDSSATSSADTDIGPSANSAVPVVARNRPTTSAARRKTEAPRRNISGSRGGSHQRPQRRELASVRETIHQRRAQQQQNTRKSKEAPKGHQPYTAHSQNEPKRVPIRRKMKSRGVGRVSEEDGSAEEGSSSSPSPRTAPTLRQWIDHYEEAVTNHYSPELRARISAIKIASSGLLKQESRSSSLHSTPTQKCRPAMSGRGIKMLVMINTVGTGQPIIELRGKYMLSSQHSGSSGAPVSKRSMRPPALGPPFIFLYKLQNTEVCVDTRTYGNDARFVRRSCNPNAQMRHCIEKGILHLYLVTTMSVERGVEITIPHDLPPTAECACGEPTTCTADKPVHFPAISGGRKNGSLRDQRDLPVPPQLEVVRREKRGRGRRNTTSDDSSSSSTTPGLVVPTTSSPIPSLPSRRLGSATQPPLQAVTIPSPTRRTVATTNNTNTTTPTTTTTTNTPITTTTTTTTTTTSTTTTTTTSTSTSTKSPVPSESTAEEERASSPERPYPGSDRNDKKKKLTREERKMEAIMKAFERLEKAELRRQENQAKQAQRRESEPASAGPTVRKKRRKTGNNRGKNTSSNLGTAMTLATSVAMTDDEGGESPMSPQLIPKPEPPKVASPTPQADITQAGLSTAAGLLLALANATSPTEPTKSPSISHPQPKSPPLSAPPTIGSPSLECSSQSPPASLSSACLLVAAAVGPLAPGFKFPKTKKGLMNEWLKGPSQTEEPTGGSPQTDLLLNPVVAESYNYKSLATLAQAANKVARQQQQPGVGSAKKRWLRQAISEECDSPNSRAESPPCPDYVTPLKKRRLARESSESFTPPTTPTGQHGQSTATTEVGCDDEDPPETPEEIYEEKGGPQPPSSPPAPTGSHNQPEQEEEEDEEEIEEDAEEEAEIEDEEDEVEEEEEDVTEVQEGIEKPEDEAREEMGEAEEEVEVEVEEEEEEEEEEVEVEVDDESMAQDPGETTEDEEKTNNSSNATSEPAKRKVRTLSINEYRQRKQVVPCLAEEGGAEQEAAARDGARSRSSSSASSLISSDEETSPEGKGQTALLHLESQAPGSLPMFMHTDGLDDKKGGEYMRWNSAPTLVERQRENLTERLRREFGLFLGEEDEQERARKQGLMINDKKKPPPPPPPPLPLGCFTTPSTASGNFPLSPSVPTAGAAVPLTLYGPLPPPPPPPPSVYQKTNGVPVVYPPGGTKKGFVKPPGGYGYSQTPPPATPGGATKTFYSAGAAKAYYQTRQNL